jgi:Mg-chelatase subunit ChlD
MVCDLGGGTFDATILGLQGTKFDPLATVGDRELGGHDWTSDLKDLAAERIILDAHEDPRNDVGPRETLYDACEQAKRGFKMVDPQMVACSMGNQMRQVSITQKDFEERTEHLIRRMLDTCENCLKKAGMGWKDLQTILMVGGSSRMRRVAEALREASGRQPELARTPDTMVVFGAAHIARGIVGATSRLAATPPGGRQSSTTSGISAEPEVRSNRALGTQAYDRDSKQVVNVLVLPHGLKAPVERSCDDFEISVDNQENFDIPVAEYEDRTFDENQYTEPGTNFRFWCRKGSRHGERIRVTLGYDKSLIIQAEAVDLTTNQALRVDRVPYRKPTAGALRIVPKWVVFALDVSGSMSEHNKISIAKDALVTNARDLLAAGGGDCKVGIVTFSAESTAICQPTSDIDEIERCVSPVSTDSTTAMDKGIREAVHMVMTAPAGVDRTVVMVTDGMPDSRDDTLAAKVFAEGRGVRLSTLGVGHDEVDEQFLGQLGPFLAVDFDKIADGIATLLSISKFGQTQGSQGSASGTRGGIWYDPTGMKGGKKP